MARSRVVSAVVGNANAGFGHLTVCTVAIGDHDRRRVVGAVDRHDDVMGRSVNRRNRERLSLALVHTQALYSRQAVIDLVAPIASCIDCQRAQMCAVRRNRRRLEIAFTPISIADRQRAACLQIAADNILIFCDNAGIGATDHSRVIDVVDIDGERAGTQGYGVAIGVRCLDILREVERLVLGTVERLVQHERSVAAIIDGQREDRGAIRGTSDRMPIRAGERDGCAVVGQRRTACQSTGRGTGSDRIRRPCQRAVGTWIYQRSQVCRSCCGMIDGRHHAIIGDGCGNIGTGQLRHVVSDAERQSRLTCPAVHIGHRIGELIRISRCVQARMCQRIGICAVRIDYQIAVRAVDRRLAVRGRLIDCDCRAVGTCDAGDMRIVESAESNTARGRQLRRLRIGTGRKIGLRQRRCIDRRSENGRRDDGGRRLRRDIAEALTVRIAHGQDQRMPDIGTRHRVERCSSENRM
ncbi:hypothetical protein RHSP_03749 [Rhizobium freirei PRF 81]|uniref:Uncharacterized protein n=1 Tax=Rhizobium freirei PRF 81 TaxID=363754 RepID=N6V301_9HYPH|nr:hypothetical protein RHSP_03749 [Rhizobium freirei PRF 81]